MTTDLKQTAARLYPDSEHLQREWLRAVRVVRNTARGWLLEQPQQRTKPANPGPIRAWWRG